MAARLPDDTVAKMMAVYEAHNDLFLDYRALADLRDLRQVVRALLEAWDSGVRQLGVSNAISELRTLLPKDGE